jgi:hypothetical protein
MADFFEEVDGLGVSETHVQKLLSLQEKEAERIIAVYRRIQAQLRKRLAAWSSWGNEDRFTAQRLRGVLIQVEEALKAWDSGLYSFMEESGRNTSIFAIENLKTEIEAYEQHFTGAVMPINIDALAVATQSINYLMNQYSVSFQRWNHTARSRIEASLTDGIAMQDTTETMIKRLLGNWGAYEWELRRIVRTELHSIYNTSKVRGMQEVRSRQLPDLKKALLHPMDKRTADDSKLLARMNPVVDINQPFRYVYSPPYSRKEYYREFMAPPDRPNDRAILIPYREAWDDGRSAAFQNVAAV